MTSKSSIRWKHLIVLFSYLFAAVILHMEFITASNLFLTFVVSLTTFVSIYSYNDLTDTVEDRLAHKPKKFDGLGRSKLKVLVMLSSIISLISAFFLNWLALLFAAMVLFIGYSYSVPYIRLKNIFFLKTVSITLGWFFLFLFLCSAISGTLTTLDVIIASFYALLSFAGSVVMDIRDIEGDEKAGLKTIPIVVGLNETASMLLGISILQYLIVTLFALFSLNSLPYFILLLTFPTRVWIYSGITRNKYHRMYYASILSYPLATLSLLIAELIPI